MLNTAAFAHASTQLPDLATLELAAALVYQALPPTPQFTWPLLNARCGTEVWLKHENHTPVGAFKVRGGLVYLDALRRNEPDVAGVVTATRGNHGQSIAFAAARHGMPALVVVPRGNSVEKNAAMRALGAEVLEHGDDFQDAIEAADRIAVERGWHRVPSFHPLLVTGVATYGLELFRGAPPLDTVYVSIGLGSGICGIIAARDALGLHTEIVGVVSSAAPAFARSLERGQVTSHPVTTAIADGMACRTPVADALAIVARGASRVIEVSDDEVEAAMRALFADTHNVAEGAGAAPLAGLQQDIQRDQAPRRAGVVLTGGNVDTSSFARVLKG
ncbi:MAG TPA: threonine dehydratase [Gemmatimonas sp.]|nr:threonine dehydratase [Gemmatimonas sp.]